MCHNGFVITRQNRHNLLLPQHRGLLLYDAAHVFL